MRHFRLSYLLIGLVTLPLGLLLTAESQAHRLSDSGSERVQLRVGVYDNPPKLFLSDSGQLSGILGDLLEAMAEREGWQLKPVPCLWHECLTALEAGHIDLLPDVAHNPARAQRFSFHEIPALLSWSQLYVRPDSELPASLLAMEGKRLAVLNSSVQHGYLIDFFDERDIDVHWVVVESVEEGFNAVRQKRADAVATNQFYGDTRALSAKVIRAPVMFLPSRLYYAAPAGEHSEILQAIDGHLEQWRNNPESLYFETVRRWQPNQALPGVPQWVQWGLGGLSLALVLALVFGVLLRLQVARQTRRLKESETRLATILNSVDAHIYIKGKDLRYQYANRKVCEWLGLSAEDILGRRDDELFEEDISRILRQNDQQVLIRGERFANEEVARRAPGREHHTFLSVKLPLKGPDDEIYALCGISTDITEHRQIQEELHQLAFFDPLTHLPNRRLVLDRLRHAQSSSAQTGFDGALVLLDVDNFKTVNEAYDHEAGDQLLRALAERLKTRMRAVDTLGRLGADEFVVIVEDLDRRPGRAATLIRELVEDWLVALNEPFALAGSSYVITVSLGAALFSEADGNIDTLLKGADLALQAAKTSGRSQLHFFNPSMQVAVNRRTQIEAALRRAIESDGLSLHLQPQVDGDRRVVAMEALARWQDPVFGTVSPGEFIPLAEATGLIVPLGRWVLEKACEYLAQWQSNTSLVPITLAVNISPAQFRHQDFVQHLEACFLRYGCDPHHLELEITESLLIDELEQTIERMTHLGHRGVRFALDDFGTGYASLSYLKRLPLHLLKIDQSFVRDLLQDPNDEAIVRTIVALSESLELSVLAEGVETEAQAQRLSELGCNLYQGYLFGRPAPLEHWWGDPRLAAPQ